VRNVRLVLPAEANHFSRLVTCTSCGREVPGLPVLSPADLDQSPGPFVCTECVEALRAQGAPPSAPAQLPANRDLERLAQAGQALARRVDELDRRLAAVAAVGQVEAVEVRLQQLEDRLAGVDQVQAVEARLHELETRLAGADEGRAVLEAQAGQLETALQAVDARTAGAEERLQAGLAELRALAAIPADVTERLHALERQATRLRTEAAELVELHAALDAGLGALRSEIGDVRTAVKRVSDSQGDIDDRIEAFFRTSLAPDEQGKGRKARKGAEADRLATMATAVEDLLGEQRQLKAQVVALAQASDTAAATASRAAAQAASLSPLRSEIKLLHREIVEQNDAMEALRKAAERPAPPAPASKKAPAAKKASRAKKA
jgi:chromosome segregation ATPase